MPDFLYTGGQYRELTSALNDFYAEMRDRADFAGDEEAKGRFEKEHKFFAAHVERVFPAEYGSVFGDIAGRMQGRGVDRPKDSDVDALHAAYDKGLVTFATEAPERMLFSYGKRLMPVLRSIGKRRKREKAVPGSTAPIERPSETFFGSFLPGEASTDYGDVERQREQAALKAQAAQQAYNQPLTPQWLDPQLQQTYRNLGRIAAGREFGQAQESQFEQPLGIGGKAGVLGAAAERGLRAPADLVAAAMPQTVMGMPTGMPAPAPDPSTLPIPENASFGSLLQTGAANAVAQAGLGGMPNLYNVYTSMVSPFQAYSTQELEPRAGVGLTAAGQAAELGTALPGYHLVGKGLGLAGRGIAAGAKRVAPGATAAAGQQLAKVGPAVQKHIGKHLPTDVPKRVWGPTYAKEAAQLKVFRLGARELETVMANRALLANAARAGAGFHTLESIAAAQEGGLGAGLEQLGTMGVRTPQLFRGAVSRAFGGEEPLLTDDPATLWGQNPITGEGLAAVTAFPLAAAGAARVGARRSFKRKATNIQNRIGELERIKNEKAQKLKPEQRAQIDERIEQLKEQALEEGDVSAIETQRIAEELKMSPKEVVEMATLPVVAQKAQQRIGEYRPISFFGAGPEPVRVDFTRPRETGYRYTEGIEEIFSKRLSDAKLPDKASKMADKDAQAVKEILESRAIDVTDDAVRKTLIDRMLADDATPQERLDGMQASRYQYWINARQDRVTKYLRELKELPPDLLKILDEKNIATLEEIAYGDPMKVEGGIDPQMRLVALNNLALLEQANLEVRAKAKATAEAEAKAAAESKVDKRYADFEAERKALEKQYGKFEDKLPDPFTDLEAAQRKLGNLKRFVNSEARKTAGTYNVKAKIYPVYERLVIEAFAERRAAEQAAEWDREDAQAAKDKEAAKAKEPPKDDGEGGAPPPAAPTTPPAEGTPPAGEAPQAAPRGLYDIVDQQELGRYKRGVRRGLEGQPQTRLEELEAREGVQPGRGAELTAEERTELDTLRADRDTAYRESQAQKLVKKPVEGTEQAKELRRAQRLASPDIVTQDVKLGTKYGPRAEHQVTTDAQFKEAVVERVASGKDADIDFLYEVRKQISGLFSMLRPGQERAKGKEVVTGPDVVEPGVDVSMEAALEANRVDLDGIVTTGERTQRLQAQYDIRKAAGMPVYRTASPGGREKGFAPPAQVTVDRLPIIAEALDQAGKTDLADQVRRAYDHAVDKAIAQVEEVGQGRTMEATPVQAIAQQGKLPQGLYHTAEGEVLARKLADRRDFIDKLITQRRFRTKAAEREFPIFQKDGTLHHERAQISMIGQTLEVRDPATGVKRSVKVPDNFDPTTDYNVPDNTINIGGETIPIKSITGITSRIGDVGLSTERINHILGRIHAKDMQAVYQAFSRMSDSQISAFVNYYWPDPKGVGVREHAVESRRADPYYGFIQSGIGNQNTRAIGGGEGVSKNAMSVAKRLLDARRRGDAEGEFGPTHDVDAKGEYKAVPEQKLRGALGGVKYIYKRPDKPGTRNINDADEAVKFLTDKWKMVKRAVDEGGGELASTDMSRKIAQRVVDDLYELNDATLEWMMQPSERLGGVSPFQEFGSRAIDQSQLRDIGETERSSYSRAFEKMHDIFRNVIDMRADPKVEPLESDVSKWEGVERQFGAPKQGTAEEQAAARFEEYTEGEVPDVPAARTRTLGEEEAFVEGAAVSDAGVRMREPGGKVGFDRASRIAARVMEEIRDNPEVEQAFIGHEGKIVDPDLLTLLSIIKDNPAPARGAEAGKATQAQELGGYKGVYDWPADQQRLAGEAIERLKTKMTPFGETFADIGGRQQDTAVLEMLLLSGREKLEEGQAPEAVGVPQEPIGGRERHFAKQAERTKMRKTDVLREVGFQGELLKRRVAKKGLGAESAEAKLAQRLYKARDEARAAAKKWDKKWQKVRQQFLRMRTISKKRELRKAFHAAHADMIVKHRARMDALRSDLADSYSLMGQDIPDHLIRFVDVERARLEDAQRIEERVASQERAPHVLPPTPKAAPPGGQYSIDPARVDYRTHMNIKTPDGGVKTVEIAKNEAFVVMKDSPTEVHIVNLDKALPAWQGKDLNNRVLSIAFDPAYYTGRVDEATGKVILNTKGQHADILEGMTDFDAVLNRIQAERDALDLEGE